MMNKTPEFEIPETMRDLAERSIEQAQETYTRFVEATRGATDMISQSSEAMTGGAKGVQEKTLAFMEKSISDNFAHAEELVKAKDLAEAIEMQSAFARKQMETFAEQAQSIAEEVGEAVQSAQPKKP